MTLLEDVRIEFNNGTLDVYQNGQHLVHQPFNSSTEDRKPFVDQAEAMTWLEAHYRAFFVQPTAE